MSDATVERVVNAKRKTARATRLVIASNKPSLVRRVLALFAKPPIGKWRTALIVMLVVAGLAFCALGYLLSSFALVLNGSKSLPHNAYAMVTYPKVMSQGIYAAFNPPAHFDRGHPFIKQVIGVPGDVIEHRNGLVCVNNQCLKPQGHTAPFIEMTPMGVIGKGQYFVAGDTDDSLDSRYASLGLVSKDSVRAVGYPIANFPHWKEWLAWLKR